MPLMNWGLGGFQVKRMVVELVASVCTFPGGTVGTAGMKAGFTASITPMAHPAADGVNGEALPTSLQRPLSHLHAVHPQAGAVVCRHLNLVVGPDDEVLQQQVVDLGVGDVLELVAHGQPGQAVPGDRGLSELPVSPPAPWDGRDGMPLLTG